MENNFKIPCFYLYIHSILAGHFLKITPIKEFTDFMHEWRIPKKIRTAMVKEMETYGLIKKEKRNYIEIKESNIDFNNVNQLYEYVGILNY